jgi:hypothetical protein
MREMLPTKKPPSPAEIRARRLAVTDAILDVDDELLHREKEQKRHVDAVTRYLEEGRGAKSNPGPNPDDKHPADAEKLTGDALIEHLYGPVDEKKPYVNPLTDEPEFYESGGPYPKN